MWVHVLYARGHRLGLASILCRKSSQWKTFALGWLKGVRLPKPLLALALLVLAQSWTPEEVHLCLLVLNSSSVDMRSDDRYRLLVAPLPLTGSKWRLSGILMPLASCDIWITQVMNKTCFAWHFKEQSVYLTQYKAGYVANLMVVWKIASQWIKPGVNEQTETGIGFDWLGNAVHWIFVRLGMENGNIWQLNEMQAA